MTDHPSTDPCTESFPIARRRELVANKDLVRAAAAQLRHAATQDAYRGLRHPERAYALASMLDMFELRWTDQDGPMRDEVRRCCLVLLGRSGDHRDPESS